MRLTHSIDAPIRNLTDWNLLWDGEDKGLIACWERGREKHIEDPQLANLAASGQLVVLPWKGGVVKKLEAKHKFGSFNYLAMWQGLRSENLDIDLSQEVRLICSKIWQEVIFTADMHKFLND